MTSSILTHLSTFFPLNDNKEHEFEKKRKTMSVVLLHKHRCVFLVNIELETKNLSSQQIKD